MRTSLHSQAPDEEVPYAPGGSLGRDLKREEEERWAKEKKEINNKGEEKVGAAMSEEARETKPAQVGHG